MKKENNILLLSALALGLCFSSCQDEEFGVDQEEVRAAAVARQFGEIFGSPGDDQDFDLYGQMREAGMTRASVATDGTVTERAFLFAEDLWSGSAMDFDYNDVVYAVSLKYNIAQDSYKFYVDPVCVASGRNQWLMLNKNYNWPTIGYCPQKGKTDVMVECHSIMEPAGKHFTYFAQSDYPADYAACRKQTILDYYQDKLSADELTNLADMVDNGGAAAAFIYMELPNSGCEVDLKDCFGTQSYASQAGYTYSNMPTIGDVRSHAADGTLLSWLYYGAVYRGNEGFFEIRSSADNKPVNVNYQAYNYYQLTSEGIANNYNGDNALTNVRNYLSNGNVPRLIMVPAYYTYNGTDCVFEWPKETVCLKDAYPNISDWVTYKNSDGTVRSNWIADNAGVFASKVRDNVTKQPSRYVDLLKFTGPTPETATIANNSQNKFRDQIVALAADVEKIKSINFVVNSSITSTNVLATAASSEANVYLSIDAQGAITVSTPAKKFLVESCEQLFSAALGEGELSKLATVGSITGLANINTESATSFYGMFELCKKLTTIEGLDKLNTSNVTNMQEMFVNCENMSSFAVKNFDVSKVTTFYGMFSGCSCENFEELDLSKWSNSIGAINVQHMFSNAIYLIELKIGKNFDLTHITKYPTRMFYMTGYDSGASSFSITTSTANAKWLIDDYKASSSNGTWLGKGTASMPYTSDIWINNEQIN